MKTFSLKIKTGNSAFECESAEIARILREAAKSIESQGIQPRKLFDLNGNSVGEIAIQRRTKK